MTTTGNRMNMLEMRELADSIENIKGAAGNVRETFRPSSALPITVACLDDARRALLAEAERIGRILAVIRQRESAV